MYFQKFSKNKILIDFLVFFKFYFCLRHSSLKKNEVLSTPQVVVHFVQYRKHSEYLPLEFLLSGHKSQVFLFFPQDPILGEN
jgi:hypothetical protein